MHLATTSCTHLVALILSLLLLPVRPASAQEDPPAAAELSLAMAADSTALRGTTVTLTLTLTNDGPGGASIIETSTPLHPSEGLTYQSHDGDGAYVDGDGVWSIDTLGVGESASLELVATVDFDVQVPLVHEARVIYVNQEYVPEGDTARVMLWPHRMRATDAIYEDRVAVTWQSLQEDAVEYRVLRDGMLLSYVSSEDTLYNDATGNASVPYTYCVESVDAEGRVSSWGCDEGRRILFAPEELAATDETREAYVQIDWQDASEIETGYRVYRDGLELASLEADARRYRDRDAAPGTRYTYCVEAVDAAGFTSEQTCDDGTRGFVLPPALVQASDGQYEGRVLVTWVDQTDAEDGYAIYRTETGQAADTVQVGSVGADVQSYSDENAAFGVDYTYCVRTETGIGSSIPICDEGIRGRMPAPTNVIASDSLYDDRVELIWTDRATSEDGYAIYRKRTGDADSVLVATTGANATSYDDTSAEPGVPYVYAVMAVADGGGTSVATVDAGYRSVVLAPVQLRASDDTYEDRVELNWQSTATRAVYVRIYRDGARIKTLPAETLHYADYPIASDTAYTYCVEAVTAGGTASVHRPCTVGSRRLVPPHGLQATDDEFEDRTRLAWQDGSDVEAGFRIYRREAGSSDDLVLVDSTDANRTSFADTSGLPGVTYTYFVRAYDAYGFSAAATDEGGRLLNAPEHVAASDGVFEEKVQITWVDASRAESGYRITRQEVGTDDVFVLAEIDANAASYTDTGMDFGVHYTYTVEPLDGQFGSSAVSDEGYATILQPGSVNASTSYGDRVVVTWVDYSAINTAYQITRDDVPLAADLAPDATSFTDESATPGSTYEYCLRAVVATNASEAACATGGLQAGGSGPATVLVDAARKLTGPSDVVNFGQAVDINGDYAVVGSFERAAYVFRRDGDNWELEATLTDSGIDGTHFGASVAIAGDYVIVGAPQGDISGKAYIFHRDGGTWTLQQELYVVYFNPDAPHNDRFGASVALSEMYAVIGAPGSSRAYVLRRDGDTWAEPATLQGTAGSSFGYAVAMYSDRIAGGAPRDATIASNAGAVYTFHRTGANTWTQEAKVFGSGTSFLDEFGHSVALDDGVLLAGAPGDDIRAGQDGAAYLFRRSGTTWSQEARLISHDGTSNDRFGTSVALSGAYALVGAGQDDNVATDAGSAYLFRLDHDGWHLQNKLMAADGAASNRMGHAVALSNGYAILGTYYSPGAAYIQPFTPRPGHVLATDGTEESRVKVTWQDRAPNEDGYRVFRNGSKIADVEADQTSYMDNDAPPGEVATYCVEAFNEAFGTSSQVCDFGRRPPNGSFTGRVATRQGAGVDSVSICLNPTPGRALQLDGTVESYAMAEDIALPDTALTVSFWLRSSDPAKQGAAFSYAAPGSANAFLVANHRNLNVFVNDEDAGASGVDVSDGQWHHVAATWRSSDGRVELYVDGMLRHAVTGIATGSALPRGVLVLGQDQDNLGGGFAANQALEGLLDDLRVWSHVRDADAIQADIRRPLDGDEAGLAVYWPVEQSTAPALADVLDAEGARYLTLSGGVYRSDDAAPLQACAVTDLEGNYALDGLRYGRETTFELRPALGERQFEPAFKRITLSSGNPVQNEVGFTDITSFTVAGAVQYAPQYSGMQCFVEQADILVDGEVTTSTDAEGLYGIPTTLGTHIITPRLGDHLFTPARREVDVDGDMSGINFVDGTTRTLSGYVGGGCGISIGTVELTITSEDECFERTIEVNGDYEIELPPLAYSVIVTDVSDVPDGIALADVISYFDELGAQSVDLSEEDQTLDVLYRAPLLVDLEGFPAPKQSCAAGLTLGEETLPNVPILSQGPTKIPLTFSVAEDYGTRGVCPVDSGTVTVFDQLADRENEPEILTIENGQAAYSTVANTPTLTGRTVDGVNRSFQKALEVTAEVGARTTQATRWALVTGRRLREGSRFVTGRTGEIPLKILRDPPGDASHSFIEEGGSVCQTFENITGRASGFEFGFGLTAGIEFEAGLGYTTEVDVDIEAGQSFSLSTTNTETGGMTICATSEEGFSTSDSPLFVGDAGDVFIGTALNLVFAETDVLQANGCAIDRSTSISFEPNGFETIYTFSRYHIENALIPQLTKFINRYETTSPDTAAIFRQDSLLWARHLLYNDQLKAEATLRENRSFDAGADYAFSQTSEVENFSEWETTMELESTEFLNLDIEASGVGFSMNLSQTDGMSFGTAGRLGVTDTRTVGYVLSDDDLGDNFTVDVKDDPVYNTPVFDLRAGASSCPWEPGVTRLDGTSLPGTTPRDGALVNISPMLQNGIDPEGTASYTLSLTNDSQTDEAREYHLRMIQESNPGGAVVKVNGGLVQGPLSFFLNPGPDGTQEATLTVDRGPTRFRYDNLKAMLYPPCEYELWQDNANLQRQDTTTFGTHFVAPCSDITLLRPLENWRINAANADDSLQVIFDEFTLEDVDGNGLTALGLEYRLQGTSLWKPVGPLRTSRDDLTAAGATESWDGKWDFGAPDGEYELRAYTECGTGSRVFSPVVPGIVDRKLPQVFEAPAPADGVLALGDRIAIRFDEPMACASVVTQGEAPNVTLHTDGGTALPLNATCDGRTVILQPQVDLEAYEDSILVASAGDLTDRAGNPMTTADPLSDTEEWTFRVRRRAFAWASAQVLAEVNFGTSGTFAETLVNGSPNAVVYTLEDFDEGLLTPSSASGTVPAGQSQAITFTANDALAKGTYRDTVRAVTALGAEELFVELQVDCAAPFGDVAAGFGASMSLAARLDVEGTLSVDTSDVVAAYVGNQLRGVAALEYVAELDDYVAFLTVFSNVELGETVTFRIWDASECTQHSVAETYPFFANAVYGRPDSPEVLSTTTDAFQTIALPEGWTWISTNMRTPAPSVASALSTIVPSRGDLIKSQTAYSQYDPSTSWAGSLTALEPGHGYMLRKGQPGSLLLLGNPVAPDSALALEAGWNWIGYLPEQAMPINDALAALSPSDGDLIKSQFGFAQYVEVADRWIGSLDVMEPGRGYLIDLAEANELTYPEESPASAKQMPATITASMASKAAVAGSSVAADTTGPGWQVNAHEHEHTMTLVGIVSVDGVALSDPGTLLGAFVGDEPRGATRPVYVEALDAYRVFMMIHGTPDEEVTFRIYDGERQATHDEIRLLRAPTGTEFLPMEERYPKSLAFAANAKHGQVQAPLPLNAGALPLDALPQQFELHGNYPNPFSAKTTIGYALPQAEHVTIDVFDVLGRRVAVLEDGAHEAGWHVVRFRNDRLASGVYFYRIKAGGFEQTRQMMIVR